MTLVPADLADLVSSDVIAHVSSIRRDGSIQTHAMWVDYDGEHVLTSSPVGSVKGRSWRRNPQAAVSVVDRSDPWRYITISGRVSEIRPDEGLAFIDKMSRRYTGADYQRRDYPREIFVITPDRIRTSRGRGG